MKNKILKYLSITLLVIGLVILVKEVILKRKPLTIPKLPSIHKRIKVDFDLLGSKEIKGLLPFEKISLPENVGRENPFAPYSTSTLK